MTRIIFIGATGTDIGKTYVTCMLLRQLQQQGYSVRAIKPVISGFDPEDIEPSDSGQLLLAMNMPATLENAIRISPWRFKDPLPPHLAAAQTGTSLDLDDIVQFCLAQVEDTLDFLLIEGVGGIMTPISYDQNMIDLISRLECACLLVTASSLGTLSHTLTAIACLEQSTIKIAGVIISESPQNYTDFEQIIDDFKKIISDIPLQYVQRNSQSETLSSLLI
ncbi:MAG: dethiobiotin synthase [Emcibacter sp.]|nr:dethiobiotin synthase [Emcibacter sp.]